MIVMKILDVGGGRNSFEKASHIIDIRTKPKDCTREYVQMDVCSGKWPYKDKEFDFVYCSNLLEDVKDPAFVCKEMIRVGKKGTIIVPSPYLECRKGVDSWYKQEMYSGFYHHRWVCFIIEDKLIFLQKTPITHIFDWTIGMSNEDIHKKGFIKVKWINDFEYKEKVYVDWWGHYAMFKNFFKKDFFKKDLLDTK